MGGTGWISVASNVIPSLAVQLYNTVVEEKDYRKGRAIYEKILPLCIRLETCGKLVQVVNSGMNMMGKVGGYQRSPCLPLSAEEESQVELILRELGVFMKN